MMDNGIMPVYTMNNDGNNNNGWGNGDDWWVIFLFFMMAWGNNGWGGFGNGNGANSPALQGALTRADLCSEFNFNNLERTAEATNRGICDLGYALNNSINGVNMNVMSGFNGVGNAICDLGYATQQGFNQTNIALMQGQNALQNQISSCCCDITNGIQGINYSIAMQTNAISNQMNNVARDIIDSQNSGTRAILDKMCQDQIACLQNEVQSLRLDKSQYQQNAAIGAMIDASTAEVIRRTGNDCPVNAYVVQPPTPVTFPTNGCGTFNNGWNNGYNWNNNGCGCGNC